MDEYDTRQLQEVENLFPEESRVPLLAVSAEKKGEEQYGANEEEDIPDEKLWTKETLAPLLGGDLNSIKTLNTRRREEDGEKLVTGAKLTFTNYGADENVVADWGDAKVPLLSASAGNTQRYLDGGVLLSRHGPFSHGLLVLMKSKKASRLPLRMAMYRRLHPMMAPIESTAFNKIIARTVLMSEKKQARHRLALIFTERTE